MSDNQELDRTLQKAILNLHEVKPKDPIRFLADYFTCKSEEDPLYAAFNLFDSLTLFHPVTEERIIKCYDILTSLGEIERILNDACYDSFIKQLMMSLHVPSELINSLLHYLNQEIPSVVSYHTLRQAILTVLLYKQYFEEMYYAFDKLTVYSGIVPSYNCKILFIHAKNCLKNINEIPRKFPYTLGIRAICDSEYVINRSSSKELVNKKFYSIRNFTTEAKETFFREIGDLGLSRFLLFDQGKHKHAEYENNTDEKYHHLYKNNKYECDKHKISEFVHHNPDTIENPEYKDTKIEQDEKVQNNEDHINKSGGDHEDKIQENENGTNENTECNYYDHDDDTIKNSEYKHEKDDKTKTNEGNEIAKDEEGDKAKTNEGNEIAKDEESRKDKDQEYEDDINENIECMHHEHKYDKNEKDQTAKTNVMNMKSRVDKNVEDRKEENQAYEDYTNEIDDCVHYEYEQNIIANSEHMHDKEEQDEKAKTNKENKVDKNVESHKVEDDTNKNAECVYHECKQSTIENFAYKNNKDEQHEKAMSNEEDQIDKKVVSHKDENQEYKDDTNENAECKQNTTENSKYKNDKDGWNEKAKTNEED